MASLWLLRRAHRLRLDTRLYVEWTVLTLGLCLLAAALTIRGEPLGAQRANQALYDISMQVFGGMPANPDIVIIAIDDNSLEALSYWPWKRSVHADLLSHLKLARAVGMDILFSDAYRHNDADDAASARAIVANGKVVLAEALSPDGQYLLEPLPHIGLQLLHVADGTQLQQRPPAKAQRALAINFTGPPLHYTTYSYSAVPQGKVPDSAFQDRIVLVGAWATGLGDQHPTAMGNGPMAGVEVLANILQNLQSGLWIQRAPALPATLITLIPILLICLILRRTSARTCTISILIAFPVLLALDALALHWLHYWVAPAGALVAIALAYPLWAWRNQEASLQYLDAELERLHIPATATTLPGRTPTRANTLSARAARLHQAVSYLEQSKQRREETLSFISHDMRAPQSTILAAIELRRQMPEQWPEATVLKDIAFQAHATLDLATQFLQLAQAESANLDRQECALGQLLAEACSQIDPLANQHGIQLSCAVAEGDDIVTVDRALLGRAVSNLLHNAITCCPAGSTVLCSLESTGSGWEITVCDNGPGIAAEKVPSLFTPYWRGASGTASGRQGNGLGLAFVATVAQRHGGDVRCESTPGAGRRFIIRLPRKS